MIDENVFDAYNKYIFQMGAITEFDEWNDKNNSDFLKFKNWYTKVENYLKIDSKNKFIKE